MLRRAVGRSSAADVKGDEMITVIVLSMVVLAVIVGMMFSMRKGADSQRGESRPPMPPAAPERRTDGLD